MGSREDRPLTRHQIAGAKRKEERIKERAALLELGKTIEPRDITVYPTKKIKIEVKMEGTIVDKVLASPGQRENPGGGESLLGGGPVPVEINAIKLEAASEPEVVHVGEEEMLDIPEDYHHGYAMFPDVPLASLPNHHGECSCSQEIRLLKQAMQQKEAEMEKRLEEMHRQDSEVKIKLGEIQRKEANVDKKLQEMEQKGALLEMKLEELTRRDREMGEKFVALQEKDTEIEIKLERLLEREEDMEAKHDAVQRKEAVTLGKLETLQRNESLSGEKFQKLQHDGEQMQGQLKELQRKEMRMDKTFKEMEIRVDGIQEEMQDQFAAIKELNMKLEKYSRLMNLRHDVVNCRIEETNRQVHMSSHQHVALLTSAQKMLEEIEAAKGASVVASTKVVALFPDVVKVYWEKFAKRRGNSKELLNLNCRLVCKSWREGMDAVLTGHSSPIKVNTTITIQNGNVRDTVEMLDRWCANFETLFWCPFLRPKELIIQESFTNSPSDMSLCLSAMDNFLKLYGMDIEKFTHSPVPGFGLLEIPAENWYINFVNWGSLMPNLQVLQLYVRVKDPWNNPRLQELCRMYPFPKFERLRSFSGCKPTLEGIPPMLIRNNHIQKLNLDGFLTLESWCFPNLTHLTCDVHGNWQFRKLAKMASPLATLEISLKEPLVTPYDFTTIFVAIETFHGLTNLRIHQLPPLTGCRALTFPKLKVLEISLVSENNYYASWNDGAILQLLSQLKLLESLLIIDLNYSWFSVSTRMQIQRKVRYFVSTLWEMLPALKRVTIKTCQMDLTHVFIRPNSC